MVAVVKVLHSLEGGVGDRAGNDPMTLRIQRDGGKYAILGMNETLQ